VQIKNYKNMKKRAFTLFELLVSISIIGILIAVASLSYGAAQKKARDARRIEDITAVQKALEMYYSQNGFLYPNNLSLLTPGLMQKVPTDPKGAAATCQYLYYPASGGYCACICPEDRTLGNSNAPNGCPSAASPQTYYCLKNQQ